MTAVKTATYPAGQTAIHPPIQAATRPSPSDKAAAAEAAAQQLLAEEERETAKAAAKKSKKQKQKVKKQLRQQQQQEEEEAPTAIPEDIGSPTTSDHDLFTADAHGAAGLHPREGASGVADASEDAVTSTSSFGTLDMGDTGQIARLLSCPITKVGCGPWL